MENTFIPALLKCRVSQNYLNQGDTLFVTLHWRNQGQSHAPERYRFVLDLTYGHQRKVENKQYNYRAVSGAFPDTMRWMPGMETAVTIRWEAVTGWSGTFRLTLRMLDGNEIPVPFDVPGHGTVTAFDIGAVNLSWNLGRPWVAEHTKPVETVYTDTPASYKSTEDTLSETNTLHLTDGISVALSARQPRIISINSLAFRYAAPEVMIKQRATGQCFADGEDRGCTVAYTLAEHSDAIAVYAAKVYADSTLAATFKLQLALNGRVLSVTVTDRFEQDGFELLRVSFPTLAEINGGFLLDFFSGGRLVPVDEAAPLFFEKPYDVRNAAALYDDENLLIVESEHIDSMLTTGVYQVDAKNRGFIGGGITCRIPAEGDRPGIPVQVPPVFTIELCDISGTPDWQTAACMLRRGVVPNSARALYRDVYFYKQLATWGPLPDESYRHTDPHPLTQNLFRSVTFDDIAENARRFSNLTDHTRQVMYVTGFQKGGFDTAYPYPYDAETRCGGLEALRRCLSGPREWNILTGLHDNFDDVVVADNFPYVAMDERGEPWHGWVWAGGPTYMTAFSRYAESGAMAERVETMNKLLPLKDTYHIDVLTAETCRYDFNPACPASAEDSFRAKMLLIDEWNRYGIDITSELLTHPAVGKIGFALHNRLETKEVYIPGDRFVPLVPMIYHGIIGYCAPSHTVADMLWGLLLGGQTFYEVDITGEMAVSRFYIQNIPAMKLYDKTMTGFTQDGNQARADYGEGSYVSVDFVAGTYRVVVDGVLIGQNFSSFVPANTPGAYLAYAFDDKPVIYPKPAGFDDDDAPRAVILTIDGEGETVDCVTQLGDDTITMVLPPMTPIKIYGGKHDR